MGAMDAAITVRRATTDDAAQIAEVIESGLRALREVYRPREATAAAGISADSTRIVACMDGRVVGTTSYLRDGDALALVGIEVMEAYRRRGVARALVGHLDGVARTVGASRLSLWTVKDTGNESVFVALGFAVVGEESSQILEGDGGRTVIEVHRERAISPDTPGSGTTGTC